ncbi:MAG: FAD-binding oxidoreductase [Anaerolineae bacterium]
MTKMTREGIALLKEAASDVHWLEGADDLESCAVDGMTPCLAGFPRTPQGVAQALNAAERVGWAVVPRGGGMSIETGNPRRGLDLLLHLGELNQILEHDRENLTVTVQAGCTLAGLERHLKGANQWLPLEAPDPWRCTVGGVLAANVSGPRRLRYGTARDLVLGLEVALVNGQVIHPGGKTMKNVAGYDLSRLFIGSWGTLGVITAATFRLLPLPARAETVLSTFASAEIAFAFAQALCGSRLFPTAVEVVSALPASLGFAVPPPGAAAAVLLEGSDLAVQRQVRDASKLAQTGGAAQVERLDGEAQANLWAALARNGDPARSWRSTAGLPGAENPVCGQEPEDRGGSQDTPPLLLRFGMPPARLPEAWSLVEGQGIYRQARAGSGLLYVALPEGEAAQIERWREAVAAMEGYLVVERAPLALRRQVDAWGPAGRQARVLRALKDRFDPRHCLNPGLFVERL